MMRQTAMVAVLATTLAVAACSPATPAAPPAPATDAPEDIAAINEVRNAFIAAYNAGDAQALANLYTEDAVSEPNNQPTLEGRQAILERLTKMFEQVSVKMNLEPEETRTIGSAASPSASS